MEKIEPYKQAFVENIKQKIFRGIVWVKFN